jgi:hypothetical protein
MTLAHQYTTIISSRTSVWIATTLHISEIFHPEAATYFIITAATINLPHGQTGIYWHKWPPSRHMSGNWIRSNFCECIMKNDDGGRRIVTNGIEYTHPHNGQQLYFRGRADDIVIRTGGLSRYWPRTYARHPRLICYSTRQESYHCRMCPLSNVPCFLHRMKSLEKPYVPL